MNKWFFLYIFHIIYINFKCLPFKQAIKLPIIVYKPKFLSLKGKIVINGPVSFGMIQLGFNRVPIFPDAGCMIQNSGTIFFNGKTRLGNDTKIVVGKTGTLSFGKNFNATCSSKIVCYNSISFDRNCLVGWDNWFIDYDFHSLKNVNLGGGKSKGYGTISVGHDVWFANSCRTYKNILIPSYTVISANTILYKTLNFEQYTMIGNGSQLCEKRKGVYHDFFDDKIDI